MNPTAAERIAWGAVVAPLAAAVARSPSPRSIGALVGFMVAKWTASTIILGVHAAIGSPSPGARTDAPGRSGGLDP